MPRAQPGQRFGGRQKGTPNKIPAQLKETILEALNGAHKDGAVGYLKWLAIEHPAVFGGLVGKVLPLTVAANVTVKDGGKAEDHNPLEFIEGKLAGIAARGDSTRDSGRLN